MTSSLPFREAVPTTTTVAPIDRRAACEQLRRSLRYQCLEQANNRQYDGRLAAANIKILLGIEFPSIAFDVERLHAGAVEVRWIDGPTEAPVRGLVARFQRDPFRNSDDPWPQVFGGAMFVMCHRRYSEAFLARVIDEVFARYSRALADIEKPTPEAFFSGRLFGVTVPDQREDLHALVDLHASMTSE
jgi:hypothetical protein